MMRKRLKSTAFHRRRQQLNQQRRHVVMRRLRSQQRRQLSQWLMSQRDTSASGDEPFVQ